MMSEKMKAKKEEEDLCASNRTFWVTLLSGRKLKLEVEYDATECRLIETLAKYLGVFSAQVQLYDSADMSRPLFRPFSLQYIRELLPRRSTGDTGSQREYDLTCLIAPVLDIPISRNGSAIWYGS